MHPRSACANSRILLQRSAGSALGIRRAHTGRPPARHFRNSRCRLRVWPDVSGIASADHRHVTDLDQIDARSEQLKERLVSATAFAGASTVAALTVRGWRGYFWFVAVGAAAWAVTELVRRMLVDDDRRQAVDRLVLAGSRDARCARRRCELASARTQHDIARRLRRMCDQSHARTPLAFRVVDAETVQAVEPELQELAEALDADAGRIPAETIIRLRQLIASPESPLLTPHPDADAKRRSIEDAERLIARCRTNLHDS